MREALVVILIGIAPFSYSQKVKTKVIETKDSLCKESYHVLKNDQNVRHGSYKRTCEAFEEKGQYDKGEKTGMWEYYGPKNELEQKIDYSNDTILFNRKSNFIRASWILSGDAPSEVHPQTEAIFLGGNSRLTHYYVKYLRYPADARRKGIQGRVLVSAVITSEGKMISEKVEQGIGGGLDEEALRIVQLLPDDWVPAKNMGKNVDTRILLQIGFKLN